MFETVCFKNQQYENMIIIFDNFKYIAKTVINNAYFLSNIQLIKI